MLFEGRPDWLLSHLGSRFTVVVFTDGPVASSMLAAIPSLCNDVLVDLIVIARDPMMAPSPATTLVDREGLAFERYAPEGRAVYLIRPDQHVAGRRAGHVVDWIVAAMATACLQSSTLTDRATDDQPERRAQPVTAG